MGDFVKNMKISYDNNDELLSKWGNIGFLDGLDSDIKLDVALLYNNMANFLVNNLDKYEKFDFLIFPVIRRIINGILSEDNDFHFKGDKKNKESRKKYTIKNLDCLDVLKKLHKLYDGIEKIIEGIHEGEENIEDFDIQAETLREFCILMIPSICKKYQYYEIFIKDNGDIILFGDGKRNKSKNV